MTESEAVEVAAEARRALNDLMRATGKLHNEGWTVRFVQGDSARSRLLLIPGAGQKLLITTRREI